MKLKVCGMRYSKNIINLAKIMPDYMGFIFWENSKMALFGQIWVIFYLKFQLYIACGFQLN